MHAGENIYDRKQEMSLAPGLLTGIQWCGTAEGKKFREIGQKKLHR